MKKIIGIFSFILCFSLTSHAQMPNSGDMDQNIDRTLEQLESFLDTFAMGQFFGPQMQSMLPAPHEMEQIQEQMRIGLQQLQAFDFSVFEDLLQNLEHSMPQLRQMIPNDGGNFDRNQADPLKKTDKPVKKI